MIILLNAHSKKSRDFFKSIPDPKNHEVVSWYEISTSHKLSVMQTHGSPRTFPAVSVTIPPHRVVNISGEGDVADGEDVETVHQWFYPTKDFSEVVQFQKEMDTLAKTSKKEFYPDEVKNLLDQAE